MFMHHQSLLDEIRNNTHYQCVSLQPDTAAKALKVAQKTGQRVCILAETYGSTHAIFVAKDFEGDAWVENFFKTAKSMAKAFSQKGQGIFDFVAPSESIASIARLSAAVNGCVYCCDEVLSCGSFRLFFYKL